MNKNNMDLLVLNEVAKLYGAMEDRLIGTEHGDDGSVDLVIYDISEMIEVPYDIEDFYSIVEENALDIYEFEYDRFEFIK